jgi:flagellar hook assembly protein FlgD
LPTGTPEAPAVLDHNIWRPGNGQPLHIGIKAPQAGRVKVHVFNVAGELVRVPFEAEVPAGITVEALWDGKNDYGEACSAGLYVVSVQGAGISSLKKVVLMK